MPLYHYFDTFTTASIEEMYKETLLFASTIWLIFTIFP